MADDPLPPLELERLVVVPAKLIDELEAERDRLREVLEAIVELGEKSPQSYQFNAEFHAAVYAARQALNKANPQEADNG